MRLPRASAVPVVLAMTCAWGLATPGHAQSGRDEPYRPQIHYTPERNWMNDPNGLVWYQGEYHLFYQYNPKAATWGNMSWGHAVSRDLLHWRELGVALPATEDEHIFSGSVVVDEHDTSGFGEPGRPAMVAVYTSAHPRTGIQAQSLAYSLDAGRTWTKYAGNPVLDLGSTEFRDPKVFWYGEGRYWVMAVALPTARKIAFYRSGDLKRWEKLSEFGPANATDGIWEVPDLFELPVDGDPRRKKWVLVVNLNPGSVAGGSGTQYFVGDFDGVTFTADDVFTGDEPPPGHVFADFEGQDHGGWTVDNDPDLAPGPFGDAPVRGTVPGQQEVTGYLGSGLVNSFVGHDAPQGRMVSPRFTISEPYIDFLVGGGRHPHRDGTGDGRPPAGDVLADFEGPTFGTGWTATGDFAAAVPHRGGTGRVGEQVVDTFFGSGTSGDPLTGTITSPEFTLARDHVNFLIAGGSTPDTAVRLLVDGKAVRTASGSADGLLNWTGWDVAELRGRKARIEIFDQATGGWGHLLVDHVVLSDAAAPPRSYETAVNLVVDGKVVRTATGQDSERLDWTSWDVREFAGKQAEIHVNDFNPDSWGHISVDHIVFSDRPAASRLRRYAWADYGKDFYAGVSWNDVPGGRRIWIGWMNNWRYGERIPTAPWRSAQSLPRELALATIDGQPRLVQRPVQTIANLRGAPAFTLRDLRVEPGTTPLPDRARGTVLEITAEFDPGTARRLGLVVRGGEAGEGTLIGYDAATASLFVDRTGSGDTGFDADFPGVQSGPLRRQGRWVTFIAYVDRSSVEVFGDRGQTVITDQIFPSPGSDGLGLFADGGTATLRSLTVRPLRSVWR